MDQVLFSYNYLFCYTSSSYLFCWRTSQLWMKVDFFKTKNPCMPSWFGGFQFANFLTICPNRFHMYVCRRAIFNTLNFFSCYLSIQPFCYVLFALSFYSKIISFPLNLVVDLPYCIFHRFFFRYFGMSCFVYIAWPYPGVFQVSLLSPVYFDLSLPVIFSDLSVVYI